MPRKKRDANITSTADQPVMAAASKQDDATAENPAKLYPPDPRGWKLDRAAGVRLLESFKFKQIQIAFDREPGDDIRDKLAQAGFVFRDNEGIFTKQLGDAPAQTRYRADGLFAEICEIIREREGHSSPGQSF